MIKTLEFCAENFTNIPNAVKNGATRIELCDNLAQGGTTPSIGNILKTIDFLQCTNVKTYVMLRPRGGNFSYTDSDMYIIKQDINAIISTAADGIVFGALTYNYSLDTDILESLEAELYGIPKTFHMAFDYLDKDKQFQAIDYLVQHGWDNILTHGGLPNTDITDNVQHLKHLVEYAGNKINIIVGAGVTHDNYLQLASTTNASHFHGTKIVNTM